MLFDSRGPRHVQRLILVVFFLLRLSGEDLVELVKSGDGGEVDAGVVCQGVNRIKSFTWVDGGSIVEKAYFTA